MPAMSAIVPNENAVPDVGTRSLPRENSRSRTGTLSGQTALNSTAFIQQKSERWVEWLRVPALVVFVLVPILGFAEYKYVPRIVWTVAIALAPLFIVLAGYHRWRRICPLAFFGRLPGFLGLSGSRTIPERLERHYYYVPLAIFVFGLWFRLVAMNGDGVMIAVFFVCIAVAAFATGVAYTGKSWCNFFCPLVFIEKVYTEPNGLRETANSQCGKCTACKKFCPDINQENSYWKELDLTSKRVAYLAFPGLIYGFYFYYYLQSGTWEYYFGGSWTNEPGLWRNAFAPGVVGFPQTYGFYFWPQIPRAVAALLTLLGCGLVSFILFSTLEIPVRRFVKKRDPNAGSARVTHVLYALVGFCAFITFYSFAGAPTLRLVGGLPHLFLIVVVLTAAVYLARRYKRTSRDFAEETFARNIVKRWEWPEPAPADLHDAFLIHSVRSKESQKASERSLEIYQDAMREALADGIVHPEETNVLSALRNQLQIKQSDHDRIMAALAEEERANVNDPARRMTAEKRLQLQNYALALEACLERTLADGKPDDALLLRFREQYRVTPEEHARVLDDLLGGTHGLGARLAEAIAASERAAHTVAALEREPTPAHDLLKDILERQRLREIHTLTRGLAIGEAQRETLAAELSSNDPAQRQKALERLRGDVAPALAERLLEAQRQTAAQEGALATLAAKLAERTGSSDPYVRALAIFLSGKGTERTPEETRREATVVRDTLLLMRAKGNSGIASRSVATALSTVEKMIALRAAPIFARLEPESLERLARACREGRYAAGEALCREDEFGNEVFILTAGDVEVVKGSGHERKLLGREKAGGFIGELAVIEPAPRSATVLAGPDGARALRLDGDAFRTALDQDAGIATEVMRTLAQRLKQKNERQ